MFHYFEDEEFLNNAYGFCADMVNQTKMLLQNDDIDVDMFIEGSKRRNMVTQSEEGPIDFDFDLFIKSCPDFNDCHTIKETVRQRFNEVLRSKNIDDCEDSRSVLSSKQIWFMDNNLTKFSIDLAITKRAPNDNYCRLIHNKTGSKKSDAWLWNEIPDSSNIYQKVNILKQEGFGRM